MRMFRYRLFIPIVIFMMSVAPGLCDDADITFSDSISQTQDETTSTENNTENTLESFQEKILRLEKEVQKLREESEARKILEMTDEEKSEKEKDILSAAGREYTLLKKGTLGLENNFKYSFHSTDSIIEWGLIEHRSNHSIENEIFVEYAVLDNLTVNVTVPLVYKYDRNSSQTALEVNDIGDLSFGFQFQPMKAGSSIPSAIVYGSLTVPSGRSPFKVIVDKDLSTGSGYYSLSTGLSINKTIDPIVAFGNASVTYNHEVTKLNQRYQGRVLEKLEPGNSAGISMGVGYAMSYKVSIFVSYQYSYMFRTKYYWKGQAPDSFGSSVSSMLNIGTRWNLSPTQSINIQLGIGLTNASPDFIMSFRIPFEFEIFK